MPGLPFPAGVLAFLLLGGCASGGDFGAKVHRIDGPDFAFTFPGHTYNVQGLSMKDVAHIDAGAGAIVNAGEWSDVQADGGTIYARYGAHVHAKGDTVVFYREGASVEVEGNARKYFCATDQMDEQHCTRKG